MTVAVRSLDDLRSAYAARFPVSCDWAHQAQQLLPAGIAHDGRLAAPFPLFIETADGARKQTVDGHDLIDYWMGHGALMLGHNPPPIAEAIIRQARRGTHFGANHPAEVRWARWIVELVPSAERVRFVASGTEATLMALRIARAATGRSRIARFEGHFHGWHDWAVIGNRDPFDQPSSAGVPPSVAAEIVVLPNNDAGAVERELSQRDIAAIILEPGGGTQGRVPISRPFLRDVRDLVTAAGTILIFDEVVTGFRISPGGVQAATGIVPDLTSLAKIVAGGLPGGAVTGRAELLDLLSFAPPSGRRRVAHPGTFNANPLTAAAGTAMLEAIADGSLLDVAATSASALRQGLNELLAELDVAGFVYGDRSIVHILLGAAGEALRRADGDASLCSARELLMIDPTVASAFRTASLYHGLDLMGPTMMVSSAHASGIVEESLVRFRSVFRTLIAAGVVPRRSNAEAAR